MRRSVLFVIMVPALMGCSGGGGLACGGAVSRVDRPAPPIEGPSVTDGAVLRVATGAPTIVTVWGSWCGPCRVEQPVLVRAATAHADVRFIGLAVQDNDAA